MTGLANNNKQFFDKQFLKKQLKIWKEFVSVKNVLWFLTPSIISLIIVSIVYPLTHKNGELLEHIMVEQGEGVHGIYDIILKSNHEVLAIVLMSLTTLFFVIAVSKKSLSLTKVQCALAIAFLCREIHFVGTTRGVYIAIGIIAVWCILWNKRILTELSEHSKVRMITVVTATTYIMSLLIQRRAFRKVLPESYKFIEKYIHIPLEEVTENAAHFCFLLCALTFLKYARNKNEIKLN